MTRPSESPRPCGHFHWRWDSGEAFCVECDAKIKHGKACRLASGEQSAPDREQCLLCHYTPQNGPKEATP